MPSPYKEHPMLRRLPVLDGRTLAASAHTGAAYHLHQITQLLNSAGRIAEAWTGDDHPPFLTQVEVNQVHWHLRSYFWELVGVFDLVLQWANDRFQLGVEESRVKWGSMRTVAGVDQSEWSRVHLLLTEAWNSEWYFETRTYRNFSHRSFLATTALIPKHGRPHLMLEPARDGQYYEDIRDHLPKYLSAMKLLSAQVFAVPDYKS